jgi:hypothetical protein
VTGLGVVILILNMSFYLLIRAERTGYGLLIFTLLFFVHIFACVWFYNISLNEINDTYVYYYDIGNRYVSSIFEVNLGTDFLVYAVQFLKMNIGGSFLDYFLLFQSFGLLGLVMIHKSIQEIFGSGLPRERHAFALLLFLPGLHFWTVSIGKDALLFLAVALVVWAALDIRRRYLVFGLGLTIMLPVRPHIAALALASMALAVMLGRGIKPIYRGLLAMGAMGVFVAILPSVQSVLRVDNLDVDTITDFLAARQQYGLRNDAGAAIVSSPFPLRIASLLFRPFYFDAQGFLGIVASVENTVWLGVFGYLAWRSRDVYRCSIENFFVRFCVVYAGTLTILLTLVNYNIGLGLRQKMMIMPAVLVVLAATLVWRRLEAQDAKRSVASDVEVRPAGVVS